MYFNIAMDKHCGCPDFVYDNLLMRFNISALCQHNYPSMKTTTGVRYSANV